VTSDTAEMKALLVTHDPPMIDLLRELFAEISIVVQGCDDEASASEILSRSKLDALVLDFDNVSAPGPLVKRLRDSPSNRNAVLFAAATYGAAKQKAVEHGANFIFERPFVPEQARVVLRTAYAQMLLERRKYFRLAVELSVSIVRSSGEEIAGKTTNLSQNGMALLTSSPLVNGESIKISFQVPGAKLTLSAGGSVVWEDKHGKAGINFECASADDQNRFAAWLDHEFYRGTSIGAERSRAASESQD
jgi:DNA-binding response OmpR family regulator